MSGKIQVTSTSRSSSRETKNKIQQNLMQKGFSSDIIQEVLQNIDTRKRR
ncbi:hypothetical protein [Carnobacterium maltaromaticum]